MAECAGMWVLLLNWRNGQDTIECMQSIVDAEDKKIKGVVVCDNGSNDSSVSEIKSWLNDNAHNYRDVQYRDKQFKSEEVDTLSVSSPFFVFIDNGFNYGFAGGNNVGLSFIQQQLEYGYVFVLNNDTVINPTTVSASVAHLQQNPKMGMCGSKVIYYHSDDLVQALGGAQYNKVLGRAKNLGTHESKDIMVDVDEVESKLDYIMGAALMITKDCLEKTGLMEEKYFLYFEEIDWATRARREGFVLGYADDSIVLHKEGATIGSGDDKKNRSIMSDYYMASSRLKFTWKFHPQYWLTVFLFSFAQGSRALLWGDFKRFKSVMRACFGLSYQ